MNLSYTFAGMNNKLHSRFIFLGAFVAAIAVALGAFGAHGLQNKVAEGVLTQQNVSSFDTGVRYQMYHALAIILVGIILIRVESNLVRYSAWFFFYGIICFSGSIYLLSTRALTGLESLKILGPITPVGGLLFMVGWLLLAIGVYKDSNKLA